MNNMWHGLCASCDVDLNATVLEFMHVPGAAELAAAYRARVQAEG